MSGWALATDLAIWILIVGSVVVFGWFLLEVARMAARRRAAGRAGGPRRGRDQDRDQ